MPRITLPSSKAGRIKLAVILIGAFLFFIIFLFSVNDTPPPTPVQRTELAEQALPPAPPNTDNSKIILELFNPSDQSLTHQLTSTTVNQQIEQTLTVTYVLTKCVMISQDDYRDVFQALILYAQATKLAPTSTEAEAMVRQIAESANASYALIYSRTSCRDPQLPELAKQVTQWTDVVLKQH